MSAAMLIAVGGGAMSALCYGAAVIGTLGALLLMLLSQLPLFLVGLNQGTRGVLAAGASGVLLMVLLVGLTAAGNYAITNALPAFVLVRQAALSRRRPDGRIEWYPPGLIMLWLSLYAGLAFLVVVLVFAGREGGLEGELRRTFAEIRDAVGFAPASPGAERMLDALIGIMPGLGASSWLLITAANAALAQGVLVRFGHQLRPSPALIAYELPGWLAGVVVAATAAGTLLSGSPGFIGRNLCLILAVPYFFEGLAVIHALAVRSGAKLGLLALLYVTLGLVIVILSWFAILAMAALGLVDQVVGLRRRLSPPRGGPGGHWE
jgi:predicted membrane protein DUF2232